jgi:nucleotide-binding universal stress UspA family protein
MKILIGYDGSEFADAAIEDLRHAGLPATAETLVFSVADVFVPPAIAGGDEVLPEPAAVRRAHQRAERKLKQAESSAKEASEHIVFKAAEWQADLIVVGSHGQSGLAGRLILGSVSQRVLYEAHCSVRIGRAGPKDQTPPLRMLVGIDGSAHSRAVVDEIASRNWPEGTLVRLLAAVDTVMALGGNGEEQTVKWLEVDDENNWDQVREVFEPEAQRLRAIGLDAAVMIRRGHPTQQLLEEAETWAAHSVFVGAKGSRGIERLLLGSVSAALAARAHCSVEIVRPDETH